MIAALLRPPQHFMSLSDTPNHEKTRRMGGAGVGRSEAHRDFSFSRLRVFA